MKKIYVFSAILSLILCLVSFLYPTLNFNRLNISPIYSQILSNPDQDYSFNFKVHTTDIYQLNMEYRKIQAKKDSVIDPDLKVSWSIKSNNFSQSGSKLSLPVTWVARNLSILNVADAIPLEANKTYDLNFKIISASLHKKIFLELSLPPSSFSAYYQQNKIWYFTSLALLLICMTSFMVILFSSNET